MKKLLLFGGILALMALAVGCSGDGTTASKTTTAATPTGSQASGGSTVTMSGFAFSPSTLTVAPGTRVTWTNRDGLAHTVTSDTGVFDSGTLANGASFGYTFSTPGTFPYHCTLHAGMTATIVVK